MKIAGADNQNGSTEAQWPKVLNLTYDEFQQSFAVAQLAAKLCALKKANSKVPLEKENLDPKTFLAQAWELIQSAREHVLREQTDAEYLVAHGGSQEAREKLARRRLSASRVPFKKLCDPNRKKGDTEMIYGVEWKVYRSDRAFDDLFWDYWNAISEIKDDGKRKEYGQSLLASWKRDGVTANTFLALAKFRRERDNRAANLPKKPKRKHRQLRAKART